ncbi:MAG: AzlC family ABC transporter permease [Coriobacteriia bacterium]|nr:AzlC family ABC transporter permease [Coriobacteriia bacterium]MBN2839542.1 AzlC family ABC transporter permease [Coriobacteriia bacterium]
MIKQDACPPPRARFVRGLRLGLPIFLGYAPIGAAFGIVARGLGFSPLQAAICSGTALAGAGQLIALQLLGAGAGAAAVVLTTAIVNLRYILFGAALSQHVTRMSLKQQAFLAFTLTDETFAVNIDDGRRGRADFASMAGVGVIAWSGWVAGTAAGALLAGVIGDPTRFGVQFAMPAMFTALLVAQAEDRTHVVTAIIAAVFAAALMIALPDPWYLIVAPVLAATVATAVTR